MNSQNDTLPLYATFISLKKNGFDLGIEEYYTFLDALHSGFRFDATKSHFEKENLFWLIQTIWLKPNKSKYEFREIFEETFREILSSDTTSKSKEPKNQLENKLPPQNTKQPNEEPKEENQPQTQTKTAEQNEYFIKYSLTNTDENAKKTSFDSSQTPSKRNFLFSENYFDISQRQLKQNFRSLPIFQPSSFSNEIDTEATIQHWAKKGFFEKPIFHRKKKLYNSVVLLTDTKGSMLSFEALGDMLNYALSEAFEVENDKKKKEYQQYFFYNVPQKHFYQDKAHIKAKAMQEIFQHIQQKKALVILYSDAGAARGGNSDGRFKATLRFVLQLKKVAHKIVWLNPLPKERWKKTTAQRISRFVEMYSLSDSREETETAHRNLQKAIHFLKGKQRQLNL